MKKSKGPCWTGYTMVGMKSKGGRKVPNCVPVKKANKGKPIPGDPDQRRKYMIDIQNPHSEYKSDIKKRKYFKPNQLSYTAAKHGASIDAGGMSALGRIEKAGMVRGTGAAIKGLNFKGVF
jgi:hypothetical protein